MSSSAQRVWLTILRLFTRPLCAFGTRCPFERYRHRDRERHAVAPGGTSFSLGSSNYTAGCGASVVGALFPSPQSLSHGTSALGAFSEPGKSRQVSPFARPVDGRISINRSGSISA